MLMHVRRKMSIMAALSIWQLTAVCLLTALGLCGSPILAQAPEPPDEPPTAKTHPNDPMIWNVDAMVEDAILQIARRYNLNKAQEEYTRLLLTQRVRAFLKIHEDDVRQLLKESIDFRTGLKPATPEAIMDWAERAMPVYEAAREAILGGNKEWRQILTEEQIKTHDLDLQQMEDQFKGVSKLLGETREGKGLVSVMGGAARPGDQGKSTGLVSTNPVSKVTVLMEDNWLAYVERFIQVFKLDEKQQNSARAGIYKEMFDQAKQYREKHKGELEKLAAELKSVEQDPSLSDRREDLLKQKAKLEQPIREGFVQMARRLDSLPTKEQRGAADPVQLKNLEQMREELSRNREIKRAGVSGTRMPPDTQPATSGPAATQPGDAKPAGAGSQPSPTTRPAPREPIPPPAPATKPAEAREPPPSKPPVPRAKPMEKPKIPDPPKSEPEKPAPGP